MERRERLLPRLGESTQGTSVVGLVTVMTEDGTRSRSHGLRLEVLNSQAETMGLPLVTTKATWESYESEFSRLLRLIKCVLVGLDQMRTQL
jgi:diphthamide synthase (EF-2-diphthine--ammonia ligase)